MKPLPLPIRLLAVTCCLISTLSIGMAQSTLDTGLVAYYPFNGDALDQSGRNNHGTVLGATLTTDRKGKPNSAYAFDGEDDYIDFGDSADFRFSTDFSISLWIEYPGGSQDGSIIYKFNNSNPFNQYGFGVFEMVCCYSSKASNYLGSFTRDDANSSNKILGAVNDTLTPGWHHVAYTNDLDGRAYIYMDGQLVDSSDVGTGTYVVAGFPLIVGADNANNSDNYEGKIDDIRLYRGLLTSSEVDSLFNEAIATSTESLSSDISYHLFPNPVKDRLMIELVKPQPEAYRVEMMSSIGTSVHTSTQILPSAYPGAYSIDMGNLPNGLYVLRISRNGKVLAYEKVVKQ